MTGGVGLGTRVLPVAWRRRAFWGFGIRWFPQILGRHWPWRSMPRDGRVVFVGLRRHYTLLAVNMGWPRLGFPVGSVFGGFLVGVAFAGVSCLGCHLIASWVEFLR